MDPLVDSETTDWSEALNNLFDGHYHCRPHSRTSFDRFDDKFVDLVVQCLSFDDKFRVECLSRRWKTAVLSRQDQLVVSLLRIKRPLAVPSDLSPITTIALKCPNISSVSLDCPSDSDLHSKVLDTITDNYNNINQISFAHFFDCNDKALEKFFKKFGQRLTSIGMIGRHSFIDCFLFFAHYARHCPNLKEFHATHLFFRFTTDFLISGKQLSFMPELKKLQYIQYLHEDRILFKRFMDYHKHLEQIKVYALEGSDQVTINYMMFALTRLRQLKSLVLHIRAPHPNRDRRYHLDSLKVVGVWCRVKSLAIDFSSESDSPDLSYETVKSIINSMKYFTELKRLAIVASVPSQNTTFVLKSQMFASLQELTHLSVKLIGYLADESFFEGIDRHLPSLQFLCFGLQKVTTRVLKAIRRCPEIRQTVFVVPDHRLPHTHSNTDSKP